MPLSEMTNGGGWEMGPSPFWMGPYKSADVKPKDNDEKKVRRRWSDNLICIFVEKCRFRDEWQLYTFYIDWEC